MHKSGERLCARTLLVEAVGDKLVYIVEGQRAKHDVSHHRASFADRVQRQYQRMGRADLVVAIRADEEEVPDVRVSDKMLGV